MIGAVVLACFMAAHGLQTLNRLEPIPSDKCAASTITGEDERMYVFALSEDSVVWQKHQLSEGGWSSWKALSNKFKSSSGPSAIRHVEGNLQVFAKNADRTFCYTTQSRARVDDDWTEWDCLPGVKFLSGPVPIVNSEGYVAVFGRGADNHVYMIEQSLNETHLVWGEFTDLGGDLTSPPAVALDAEGLLHIFYRGTDRALWHRQQGFGSHGLEWSDWACLGGVLASSPRVPSSLNSVNLVEVFVRAADKALWHRKQVASIDVAEEDGAISTDLHWSPWQSLGGVLASGPASVLTDNNVVDVFARATDKAIYVKSQFEDETGVSHFSPWRSMSGTFSSTPTVVRRTDGMLDIFARGVDKAIWHAHQLEVNGTQVFTPWKSLGGHTRRYTC